MLILFAAITPRPILHEQKDTMFEVANLTFTCKLETGSDCLSMIDPVYAALGMALFPKGVPAPVNAGAALSTVSFNVKSGEYAKDIAVIDEAYEIFVNSSGIFVSCNTGDGIARAFASLT